MPKFNLALAALCTIFGCFMYHILLKLSIGLKMRIHRIKNEKKFPLVTEHNSPASPILGPSAQDRREVSGAHS